MISSQLCSELTKYWRKENVVCERISFNGSLFKSELAEIWELVGMPRQDWWLFEFTSPIDARVLTKATFGKLGQDYTLVYDLPQNLCLLKYPNGIETFGNSSFAKFAQFLMLFDKACKRIRRECDDDSGEDAARAREIFNEAEMAMRSLDEIAFQKESDLWPLILADATG